jgi:hypothetical protein
MVASHGQGGGSRPLRRHLRLLVGALYGSRLTCANDGSGH